MNTLFALWAWYHRLQVKSLLQDKRWHLKHGANPQHPYVRGLDHSIAQHNRALVRLGYNL